MKTAEKDVKLELRRRFLMLFLLVPFTVFGILYVLWSALSLKGIEDGQPVDTEPYEINSWLKEVGEFLKGSISTDLLMDWTAVSVALVITVCITLSVQSISDGDARHQLYLKYWRASIILFFYLLCVGNGLIVWIGWQAVAGVSDAGHAVVATFGLIIVFFFVASFPPAESEYDKHQKYINSKAILDEANNYLRQIPSNKFARTQRATRRLALVSSLIGRLLAFAAIGAVTCLVLTGLSRAIGGSSSWSEFWISLLMFSLLYAFFGFAAGCAVYSVRTTIGKASRFIMKVLWYHLPILMLVAIFASSVAAEFPKSEWRKCIILALILFPPPIMCSWFFSRGVICRRFINALGASSSTAARVAMAIGRTRGWFSGPIWRVIRANLESTSKSAEDELRNANQKLRLGVENSTRKRR